MKDFLLRSTASVPVGIGVSYVKSGGLTLRGVRRSLALTVWLMLTLGGYLLYAVLLSNILAR